MIAKHLFTGAALAAALFVSACAGTTTQTQLAAACQGYASTLASLALNKNQLDVDDIATVNQARGLVNPVCTDLEGAEDYQSALATVRDATRKLNEVNQ